MNIVIFEDNLAYADILRKQILRVSTQVASVSVRSGCEIDNLADTNLIFMDIELHDQSGIELSKRIAEMHTNIQFIFISAYPIYSQDIFESKPLYFLIKPAEDHILIRALEKAFQRIFREPTMNFLVQTKGRTIAVPTDGIIYIESSRRELIIITRTQSFRMYGKLDDVSNQLPPCFLRCHQSYILNLQNVSQIEHYAFRLKDDTLIPISQSKFANAKAAFIRYLGESL